MRIDSLIHQKYFFQLIQEEPQLLKRFSLLLILIPLTVLCFLYSWNIELILIVALGYICALVGFFTAYSTGNADATPFKKRIYQKMIGDNNPDLVLLQDNRSNKIVHVNTTFVEELGLEDDIISSIRFEDFVDKTFLQKVKKHQKSKLFIRPFLREEIIQIKRQNGEILLAEMTTKHLDGEDNYTIYTFQDVTEKKVMEKATQQFALDLIQRKQNKVVSFPRLKVS